MSSSGVIRDPPPIPVMPTRMPTQKPKTMMTGSMRVERGSARSGGVQAALELAGARPAPSAPVARHGARAAADRAVPLVVQLMVGQPVLGDVRPDVPLRPRGQRG